MRLVDPWITWNWSDAPSACACCSKAEEVSVRSETPRRAADGVALVRVRVDAPIRAVEVFVDG